MTIKSTENRFTKPLMSHSSESPDVWEAIVIPTFDIFKGRHNEDAIWVEAVEGLAAANKRVKELAAHSPGRYFLYDYRSRKILASIDTTQTKADGKPT